jgi:hypothetical protein
MAEPQPPRDYCPTCGVAYEPLQEYCLECGTRLPTNRGVVGFLAAEWQRRISWYPGDWIWPVLLFLVLTIVATAAAVAASASRDRDAATIVATGLHVPVGPGVTQATVATVTQANTLPTAPAPTITNGTLPRAPGSQSTNSVTTPTPTRNPNALTFWPEGKSGWTNVLESLPLSAGRSNAVARARAAKRAGLTATGVIVSAQYSSLHPGYYVVFSGVYPTQAAATAALAAAHSRGFPDAYQTRVTR